MVKLFALREVAVLFQRFSGMDLRLFWIWEKSRTVWAEEDLTEAERAEEEDAALILHTSGTTGTPKAVSYRE